MLKTQVTSLDVAKRAGVSQSAVSRVFTPGASASAKTIAKVKKAALELGYRPNVIARSLITGRSRIIGLAVAYLENQFYPTAIELLSNQLQEIGYHVLVFTTTGEREKIDAVLNEILDYQVDGIVLASVSMSSDFAAKCENSGIPVVLFNRSQDDDRLSAVTSNNISGGKKIAQYFIHKGHKKIGYIAGWEGASTQRDREAGFLAGLKENGVNLFAREVGDFNFNKAAEAARKMFDVSADKRPDAVFVANDHMAFVVMDVLRFELNLEIPKDVSVIGYDDVPLASWPSYNLTTVSQSCDHMVDETVKILMARIIHGDQDSHRLEIDGDLIIRGSSQ